MANFGTPNDFYTSGPTDNAYNFEMPEFDQELYVFFKDFFLRRNIILIVNLLYF